MTPPMHRRVRSLLVDAGLADGYKVQMLTWSDTGKKADRFMVFRPSGGGNIDPTVSSEYYVVVDVVSAFISEAEATKLEADVQSIIDYVRMMPQPHDCIGYISNLGGIPSPVTTTEGRIVYRLQFATVFGD